MVLEQIVGGIPGTQRTVGQVIPRCWDRHGFLGRIWSEWDHCVAHTVASIWAGLVADTRHTLCFRHRLLIREVGYVEGLPGANPHTRHHRNVAFVSSVSSTFCSAVLWLRRLSPCTEAPRTAQSLRLLYLLLPSGSFPVHKSSIKSPNERHRVKTRALKLLPVRCRTLVYSKPWCQRGDCRSHSCPVPGTSSFCF